MTNNKTQETAHGDNPMNISEAVISKYKKPLLYGLIAIAVIIGGYFLYRNFIVLPHEQKAEELLYKGQEYFAQDQYVKALNGDGQGYPGFIAIANEYGNTPSGNLANLYAGLSYAKQDKYKEAADCLESFNLRDDQMISPAALGALGNCYANMDKPEEAVKALEKAAKLADNNSLSPIYLIQAGQIYESMGKKDEALACYQQIKTKYVNSMQFSEIDKYIERVSK